MGQILHGSATTYKAVRRAIQHSQESLRALAKRHGVNPKTIAKWKSRKSVCDLRTGPKQPRSPVLTVEEEAVVVAFRRHTLTTRLAEIVRLLGHSAGGRPSERLMRRLGMPVSDTTILASVKHHAKASSENGAGVAVRVVGVDDWAW